MQNVRNSCKSLKNSEANCLFQCKTWVGPSFRFEKCFRFWGVGRSQQIKKSKKLKQMNDNILFNFIAYFDIFNFHLFARQRRNVGTLKIDRIRLPPSLYGQMDRFRVKHALCLRVKSRSLIVGTGGLRSGAMALPSTDSGTSSCTMYGE